MGDVVAVLEKQRSISTRTPSPADKRGRKGGGATKQMSKRNWQVSNTINSDILHHHQKRSERFWIFSKYCYQNTFSPPPISPSSVSHTCSKAGQEPAGYVSLQTRLCQQENPLTTRSKCCQPVQSSLSLWERRLAFAWPLWITGIPVISLQTTFRTNNHIHSCTLKSLKDKLFPGLHLWLCPLKPTNFHNTAKSRIWPCMHVSQTTLVFFLS